MIFRQIKLSTRAGKTNCLTLGHQAIVSITELYISKYQKFMKGVLLGELIVDQETVGPLWDEMIRYHIHKNLLMEPIMIHFTSLHYSHKFDFNIIIQSLLLCSRSNFMISKSNAIYISCLYNLQFFEHMYVDTAITNYYIRLPF